MLRGEQVVLRPLGAGDFAAWYDLTSANVEISLLGLGNWVPFTRDLARKHWQDILLADPEQRVRFAVEVNGGFIGHVALKDIDRRSQHAWLSIVLAGGQVGRGYGRDALRTLLHWAFEIQNLRRISLETWATNERALRCYRAVGFVEEGCMREMMWLDGQYVDAIQMGLLRHEWREFRPRSS